MLRAESELHWPRLVRSEFKKHMHLNGFTCATRAAAQFNHKSEFYKIFAQIEKAQENLDEVNLFSLTRWQNQRVNKRWRCGRI